ncbi:hypothetical protein [Argonema antarcticum]|uniref:hypothetical protein n=1 Tax=Argonema antarcticum TaxID=2942763 RepID=UPI0020135557|nr:hypothetical protein [Argonema antarcticum]MCL1469054.1 hypothetical protein [Argonema antarcticum A004/B2]
MPDTKGLLTFDFRVAALAPFLALREYIRTVLNAQSKAETVFVLSTQHSALSTLLY